MAVSFTKEQQRVIDVRGKNILVSAAAGSGKTAVLVERILGLVCDEKHPVNIDELLVVTFTNAAAAEMRERIGNALAARLQQAPESEHLQRQTVLLHHAQITTIDSFCMYVLRNHFNDIGLDPGFRVADEGEIRLLRQDVLSALLEEKFAEGAEDFLYLADCYGGGRGKQLEEIVLRLHACSESLPWPEEWLRERREDYRVFSLEELEQKEWVQNWLCHVGRICGCLSQDLEQALLLCGEPDGPSFYSELLAEEAEAFQRIARAKSLAELESAMQALSFGRLPGKKDPAVDPEKRERVKALRDGVKKQAGKLREAYFGRPFAELPEQMRFCSRYVEALADLTLEFSARLTARKREKNVIDFSDMEHLALRVLVERKEDGTAAPTAAAIEYRRFYQEILIDEYQDSNLVQEFLLTSICGEAEGRHDLFLVGDVKQSIYRFRLARPEIFMEKQEDYGRAGPADGKELIRLNRNFRSRPEVLDSVNRIFARIMRRELGGVEYEESVYLYPGAQYPETGQDGRTELLLAGEDRAGGAVFGAEEKEGAQASGAGVSGAEEKEGVRASGAGVSGAEAKEGVRAGGAVSNAEEKEGARAGRAGVSGAEEKEGVRAGGAVSNAEEKEGALTGTAGVKSKATDPKEQEARAVAVRIRELVGQYPIWDPGLQTLRPAAYRDIVILLRSPAGWDETFKRVLQDAGIPVYLSARTGYFAAQEVQTVLQFLQILDNPLQDIPFYAVLHSCIGGFAEEETAFLKGASGNRKKKLYRCVRERAEQGGEDPLTGKCRRFLVLYEGLRQQVVWLPIHKLLRELFDRTGYPEQLAAMPAGEQRLANVQMLLQKAEAFTRTSYFGLFHFLRYMEQVEKYDVDFGEANILDENADTVRLMSIHKSKGLEFPICFVCGLAKKFNRQDGRQAVPADMDTGLGVDEIDPVRRTKTDTFRKKVLAEKLRLDNLGEELRVLYVAMTRAKEKLILSGFQEGQLPEEREPGPLSYAQISGADCYLELLLSAGRDTLQLRRMGEQELSAAALSLHTGQELLRLQLEKETEEVGEEEVERLRERFLVRYPHENLQRLFSKTTVSELKKAGMQEEADESLHLVEEERIDPYLPRFLREEEPEKHVSGSDRGTAYHKVMELWDFRKAAGPGEKETEETGSVERETEETGPVERETEETGPVERETEETGPVERETEESRPGEKVAEETGSVEGETEESRPGEKVAEETGPGRRERNTQAAETKEERNMQAAQAGEALRKMQKEGRLPAAYAALVRPEKIEAFLRTSLAARMEKAAGEGRLRREQPFVLGVPASELDREFPAEETVLIQGIIDVWFEEEDGIVVADYKTDAVREEKQLTGRYAVQLDWYAKALQRITGKKVKEKILYSFALGKEILL